MNFLKKNTLTLLWCLLVSSGIFATIIEFKEDGYLQNASPEVVALAQKAADFFGYKENFEVIEPKKPGIEINPSNKFIASGINPITKNPLIIINPQWFKNIPEDQQLFLLGRNFLGFQNPYSPLLTPLTLVLRLILTILLTLLVMWLLSKTTFVQQKKWVRIVLAFGIVCVCNEIVVNPLQIKILQYLSDQHNNKINNLVLEKTNNKQAALKALEHFSNSIKEELHKGETFWKAHETMFENFVKDLQK